MDVVRIIRQLQSSTSVTLARFLSESLEDKLTPLENIVLCALVVCTSRVLGHEYTISILSRRLAILLAVEKIKPYLLSHIDNGYFFHVHGLFVNMGFLCAISVLPESWNNSEETAMITMSLIYLYNDTFDFALAYKALHLTLLIVSVAAIVVLSFLSRSASGIFKTFYNVMASSLSSLALSVIQANLDPNIETALLQFCILFCIISFVQIPGTESFMDYIIFSIAGALQFQVKSNLWYWWAIFFVALQFSTYMFTVKSISTRVLLLLVVNLAVSNTISYIRVLARYDTIITLKTSSLVIQFVVHHLTEKAIKKGAQR